MSLTTHPTHSSNNKILEFFLLIKYKVLKAVAVVQDNLLMYMGETICTGVKETHLIAIIYIVTQGKARTTTIGIILDYTVIGKGVLI